LDNRGKLHNGSWGPKFVRGNVQRKRRISVHFQHIVVSSNGPEYGIGYPWPLANETLRVVETRPPLGDNGGEIRESVKREDSPLKKD